MRTPRILIVAAAVATLLLAGCGESGPQTADTPSPSATADEPTTEPTEAETEDAEPEPEPEPEGTVVDIAIDGDSVEPSGARVEAELGEPVVLRITSDREGELHVHSTPEQLVAFSEGTTEAELSFEQPGVVEVEDHHSGLVIVQLQVS